MSKNQKGRFNVAKTRVGCIIVFYGLITKKIFFNL